MVNGYSKVRIAIYHNHATSYIVTNFQVHEKEFKDGKVINRPDAQIINSKLRHLLNTYQDKLEEIENIGFYSAVQLKAILTKSYNEVSTFQGACASYVEQLRREGRDSYADLMEYNCRTFTEFSRGDYPLSGINQDFILFYRDFLIKKRLSPTTINMQLSRTKVIINYAVNTKMVSYDGNIFGGIKIPSSQPRDLDISMEAFNLIRTSHPRAREKNIARDLFLLSFYTGGTNLADLVKIDFSGKEMSYVRTKTRNRSSYTRYVTLTINERAREIVGRWLNKRTGRLDFGLKYTYRNFQRYVTRGLGGLVKELGITEKVTFYSARKTFSQFAFDIGVSEGVIDYCLGHSNGGGVIRYYKKTKMLQGDNAIRRVIEYTENPEGFKDVIELNNRLLLLQG